MVPGFDPHLEQLSFLIIELSACHTQGDAINPYRVIAQTLVWSGNRLTIRMIPIWIGINRSSVDIRKKKMIPNWIRIIRANIDSSKRDNPCLKLIISARVRRTGGNGSLYMPDAISTCCLWMYTSSCWVWIKSWSSVENYHSQTAYMLHLFF